MAMTREEATTAVAAVTAQRDGIQANLLDLDGSFGKRLLAGATLAGETRQRWEAASAELATLWETFTAYSAVADRAAETLARVRRPSAAELAEITNLLAGASVRLPRAPAPLARRDLTDIGGRDITLAAAVAEMNAAYARVAEVVASAESVWNEVSDRLDLIAAELGQATRQADGLADNELSGALAAAGTELGCLRETLNSDPLVLWRRGQLDSARLDRLREQTAAMASRVAELARLRDDAQRRIAAATAAVAAAQAAWQDALAARERAAAKIAGSPPPPEHGVAALADRLATLDALKAGGRWLRLAAELDIIEEQAATAAARYRDAEREAVALLRTRAELRGRLEAYEAKAATLGGAEDAELTARYDQARDLLWTAPCDLAAAADAVTRYQHAVLALGKRGRG